MVGGHIMQIDGVGSAQPKGVGVSPKAPQQAQEKQASSGEEVSLHQPPKWAQVLVQQALQFALEINGQRYQAPKAKEPEVVTPETLFDFQSVADNVLQFITGRLGAARADGKSDDDLTEMMEQARKGVDMGFGAAREQLGDWATENEDIKTGIDQSYKLIQDGLEEFEKEFFGKVSTTEMGAAEMASRQQGYLEIQTKDGDKVVLRFNDSWQVKSENSESGSQFSLKSSQSFSFSLEGDLSSDEMDSIGKLIKGIDDLAGNFFSGNFEDLLKKAGELKLDDSQLASYSLKLKQSVKLSQTYQGASSLQDLLKPLADYLPKLNQVQQQADTLLPESQQQALTPAVLAARGQNEPAQVNSFTSFNQRMLEALRMIGQFQPATEPASKSV
ncbi:ATP/GTP-binding protein [Aeromonas salmonicida]|nr:ATP/GTP-binding protein [Aeromonas salmonicida]